VRDELMAYHVTRLLSNNRRRCASLPADNRRSELLHTCAPADYLLSDRCPRTYSEVKTPNTCDAMIDATVVQSPSRPRPCYSLQVADSVFDKFSPKVEHARYSLERFSCRRWWNFFDDGQFSSTNLAYFKAKKFQFRKTELTLRWITS